MRDHASANRFDKSPCCRRLATGNVAVGTKYKLDFDAVQRSARQVSSGIF
jgi:hypothetical protein